MSELDPALEAVPDGVSLLRGEADLAAAAAQLRESPPPRAVEVADRVLARALATPRRSRMLRARAPYDFLRVSSLVVTAVLRERIDAGLAEAAVRRVVLDVTDDDVLSALTVELFVQYGADVLATADRARALAHAALAELLGAQLQGEPTHVHVSDVTVGDPHLVDPSDESAD